MEKSVTDFLDTLDKEAIETEAFFGIREYGGGSDESFIYANKSGLLRYSISLLEGYLQVDKVLESSENSTIPLPNSDEADWVDLYGSTHLDYIKPTSKNKSELIGSKGIIESNWKDKIVGYLIGGFVIGFIVLAFIGFFTVINWI